MEKVRLYVNIRYSGIILCLLPFSMVMAYTKSRSLGEWLVFSMLYVMIVGVGSLIAGARRFFQGNEGALGSSLLIISGLMGLVLISLHQISQLMGIEVNQYHAEPSMDFFIGLIGLVWYAFYDYTQQKVVG